MLVMYDSVRVYQGPGIKRKIFTKTVCISMGSLNHSPCLHKMSITYFWGFVVAVCKYFKEKTSWVLQPALNGAVKFLSGNFFEGRRV